MAAHHRLDDRPEHLMFGFLDGSHPPVLRIASGDRVTIEALPAGDASRLPPDKSLVLPSQRLALNALTKGPGAHMLTGPVWVEGALPGDVLQVDIESIELRQDWGFTIVFPLLGTIPEDFDLVEIIYPSIDRERRTCQLPWGTVLPLDPFFGMLGTTPPAHWGRITTNVPRAFGGNMDNKELRAGSTLYLPVMVEGALFYAGDGHGLQGDGEVCISALETSLTGTFKLTLRKDLGYVHPFAEDAKNLVSIGIDEDLDDAAKQAVREMIRELVRRTVLTPTQAYMLCSLAGDLRVTQTVDGNKGCHMVLAKAAFADVLRSG